MNNLARKLQEYRGLFGWRAVPLAVRSRLARQPVAVKEKIPFVEHLLNFRLKTSDVPIAAQIFLNQEYAFIPRRPVKTIIDSGANTGFSALYLAERFPEAEIVALEPEQSNFELLCENTAACARIHPEQLALWNRDMPLEVVDWFGKCGFRTQQAGTGLAGTVCDTVLGVTIPHLMKKYKMEQIDFLKLDIEGAEKTVLSGNPEWLSRVGVMAVEVHDWLDPECSRIFREASSSFDVHWRQGENEFCAREGWV